MEKRFNVLKKKSVHFSQWKSPLVKIFPLLNVSEVDLVKGVSEMGGLICGWAYSRVSLYAGLHDM